MKHEEFILQTTVSIFTAQQLHKLGFDEPVPHHYLLDNDPQLAIYDNPYYDTDKSLGNSYLNNSELFDVVTKSFFLRNKYQKIAAPSIFRVQQWILEKYDLYICSEQCPQTLNWVVESSSPNYSDLGMSLEFRVYDAELHTPIAALKFGIEYFIDNISSAENS